MKLFHFTKPSLYPQIAREGLRPDANVTHGDGHYMTHGVPCVWFYDIPERPIMSDEFATEYGSGYRQNLPDAFLRLDVTIPKNDPRLHQWPLWAAVNGFKMAGLPEELLRIMATCWIFFGGVKPKRIRPGLLTKPLASDTELRKIFDEEMKALGVHAEI